MALRRRAPYPGRRALVELSGLGGVLFGQETSSGPEPRSVLTIKLLPANFAAALERLTGVATPYLALFDLMEKELFPVLVLDDDHNFRQTDADQFTTPS